MKILFISAWFPYPPINGAKIRIYNLIRELSRNHEITLLAFAQTIPIEEARNSIPELTQYCRSVKVVPFVSFDSARNSVRSYLLPQPRLIVHTHSPEMARLVDETAASDSYDLVIVSEVGAPSVTSLYASRISGVPKILDALEVAYYQDAYYGQKHPIKRLRNGLTWFKYRRFTRNMLQRSDACTVPSREEKYNLEKLKSVNYPVEVIPHCLDIDYYRDSYGPVKPQSLAFTGSFSHYANLDAVRYFLEDIYPTVQDQNPRVNMKIIGGTNQVDIDQLRIDKSITFTGLVRDVRPEVACSWLSVVPLRVGAGTRLKIIESMALGTPVISTSKGAEGLDVTHGENILIADDPKEFAQAVLSILESTTLREKLSVAGFRLVSEKYSSEFMGRKFEELIKKIISLDKMAINS